MLGSVHDSSVTALTRISEPLMSTRPLFQDVISHTLQSQGDISPTSLSQTEFLITFCLRVGHHSPLGVRVKLTVPFGLTEEPWWFSRYSDWLWARWPRGQSSSSGRAKVSLLSKSYTVVQELIQPPSQWVSSAYLIGGGGDKRGRETNHSSSASVEIKNIWIYTSISHSYTPSWHTD
jgi:hypothetical protein